MCISPVFIVTEVHRDEITNALSITAYDALYWASNYYYSEINLSINFAISNLCSRCAEVLKVSGYNVINVSDNSFTKYYPTGVNYEGTETIREVLDDIAEATQTIYYIDCENRLIFKRLAKDDGADLAITKDWYFELDSGANRRLSTIVSTTELGDNVEASLTVTGST